MAKEHENENLILYVPSQTTSPISNNAIMHLPFTKHRVHWYTTTIEPQKSTIAFQTKLWWHWHPDKNASCIAAGICVWKYNNNCQRKIYIGIIINEYIIITQYNFKSFLVEF